MAVVPNNCHPSSLIISVIVCSDYTAAAAAGASSQEVDAEGAREAASDTQEDAENFRSDNDDDG